MRIPAKTGGVHGPGRIPCSNTGGPGELRRGGGKQGTPRKPWKMISFFAVTRFGTPYDAIRAPVFMQIRELLSETVSTPLLGVSPSLSLSFSLKISRVFSTLSFISRNNRADSSKSSSSPIRPLPSLPLFLSLSLSIYLSFSLSLSLSLHLSLSLQLRTRST